MHLKLSNNWPGLGFFSDYFTQKKIVSVTRTQNKEPHYETILLQVNFFQSFVFNQIFSRSFVAQCPRVYLIGGAKINVAQ